MNINTIVSVDVISEKLDIDTVKPNIFIIFLLFSCLKYPYSLRLPKLISSP